MKQNLCQKSSGIPATVWKTQRERKKHNRILDYHWTEFSFYFAFIYSHHWNLWMEWNVDGRPKRGARVDHSTLNGWTSRRMLWCEGLSINLILEHGQGHIAIQDIQQSIAFRVYLSWQWDIIVFPIGFPIIVIRAHSLQKLNGQIFHPLFDSFVFNCDFARIDWEGCKAMLPKTIWESSIWLLKLSSEGVRSHLYVSNTTPTHRC